MPGDAGRITSREYKLMLHPERFEHRGRGSRRIGDLVEMLAEMHGGRIVRHQKGESKRTTRYLDTQDLLLHRHGLVFRVREEPDRERTRLTLKCRDADRYLSAASPVTPAPRDGAGEKFEEDVLPAFHSMFSRSGVVETRKRPKTANVTDLIALYPGLEALHLGGGEKLSPVNRFTAYEIMRKLAKLRFGDGPRVRVCVSLWYLAAARARTPLVAELSYDFDAEDGETEGFHLATCRGAGRLFRGLQKQSDWIQLGRTTKTAYAFGGV